MARSAARTVEAIFMGMSPGAIFQVWKSNQASRIYPMDRGGNMMRAEVRQAGNDGSGRTRRRHDAIVPVFCPTCQTRSRGSDDGSALPRPPLLEPCADAA